MKQVTVTSDEVKRIGGIDLSQSTIRNILESLEFEVEEDQDALLVTAPDHRMDIEFGQDLIEEVCRIYGYDRIPTTEMSDTLPPQRNNWDLEVEERIKDILVQLGLQEVITYRMTSVEREAHLLPRSTSKPDDRPYVTLANPISIERDVMRHSLLASVLEIVAANSRFRDRITVFEIGQVYLSSEEGNLPDELRKLVITMRGPREPGFWGDDLGIDSIDYYDLKGIVEDLFSELQISDFRVEAGEHPTYQNGRTARLFAGRKQIGLMGVLNPRIVHSFDIRGDWPVIAVQIDLETVISIIPKGRTLNPVSSYPAVNEDIALIIDKDLPASEITAVIKNSGGFLLRDAELFDVYEGSPIPSGKKSLAYHLTFQSPDRTLTDKAVRKLRERVVKQLAHRFGARLRDA
jgi:phenylalanyl-tRNA synthetase beta chain